jgi:hypothetical protein
MSWADVEAKFHLWADQHLPPTRRNAIVKATATLSDARSVRELMSLVGTT